MLTRCLTPLLGPRYEETLNVDVRPTAAAATRILSGDVNPGMLTRAPTSVVSPLGGDVMRAMETFNAASGEQASASGASYLLCEITAFQV